MRALFEVAVCRSGQNGRENTSALQMIDKRVWLSHTPLRQFKVGDSE